MSSLMIKSLQKAHYAWAQSIKHIANSQKWITSYQASHLVKYNVHQSYSTNFYYPSQADFQ
jgi:hypothetical protein